VPHVEVDIGVGLPCCAIVGLADPGIREGRLRAMSPYGRSVDDVASDVKALLKQ